MLKSLLYILIYNRTRKYYYAHEEKKYYYAHDKGINSDSLQGKKFLSKCKENAATVKYAQEKKVEDQKEEESNSNLREHLIQE